jgi:hypothetical protein
MTTERYCFATEFVQQPVAQLIRQTNDQQIFTYISNRAVERGPGDMKSYQKELHFHTKTRCACQP